VDHRLPDGPVTVCTPQAVNPTQDADLGNDGWSFEQMSDWITLLQNTTTPFEVRRRMSPYPNHSMPQRTAWAAGHPSSPCLAQARMKMDQNSAGTHRWPLAAVISN
jgi:hypothetical protein